MTDSAHESGRDSSDGVKHGGRARAEAIRRLLDDDSTPPDDSDIHRAMLEARRAGPVAEPLLSLPSSELFAPLDASGASEYTCEAVPVIQGYTIGRQIGCGGQALVFEAVHQATGRHVAVKVFPGGLLTRSKERARIEREAAILAKLDHPGIVSILDRGRTSDGSFFLAMPLVRGQPLDQHLQAAHPDGGSDVRAVVELFALVAAAVGEAHRAGVIHRDLKPSNVRVDDRGQPHVLDFGLARPTGDQWRVTTATSTGQVVGSLPWASPEQAAGSRAIDIRTDVYSLGVMLYNALTETMPYPTSGALRDVLENILTAVPGAPSRTLGPRRNEISPQLDGIVLKALAKRPEVRYPSASALGDDLLAYLGGGITSAPPPPKPHRWRRSVVGVFLTLVLVAGGGIYRSTRGKSVTVTPLVPMTNSLGMRLVRIPAGRMLLGSPASEEGHDWSERQHQSEVATPFFLSVTEVTRGQYFQVMGDVPGQGRDDLPVGDVSYDNATDFCRRLSARESRTYRLPTEAEWEYACRAGSTSMYGGTGRLDEMGWFAGNSGGVLHPVAAKQPNHWGLYDLHGGVAEWCVTPLPASAPNSVEKYLPVVRGGGFDQIASNCRAASRLSYSPSRHTVGMGFRVVLEAGPLP